jgi:hypothetical protein
MQRKVRYSASLALASIIAVTAGVIIPIAHPSAATAANAADFQPGFIFSDEIFFGSSTMNEAAIQVFLEQRVTQCRALAGNPVCLRDYRTDSGARPANNQCSAYQGGTNERASRVIYNVAQACNMNPQVLLVLLEKEQSLVTSTAPSERNYRAATGYACYDDGQPCAVLFSGFANQVYSAARQFVRYGDPGQNFRYQAGRNNMIQWHPNAGCGSSTVFIENRATAALYNYTPYRPNQAALNNLYGLGDTCSSYGNRNSWRIFSDWFGSPIISKQAEAFVNALYVDVLGRTAGGGELMNWGLAVTNGMPRSQVAGGFVGSDEFRLLKIDLAYREVLGREPEPAGRLSWLNGMRQGTLSPDDAYRVFMQSQEYFNSTGGALEPFVGAVYARILKRPAAPSEVAYWASQANTLGRAVVVDRIWNSVETSRTRVADMYSIYLGRVPDQPGLEQWGGLALRFGDSWVRSAIMGSGEYLNRALSRYP